MPKSITSNTLFYGDNLLILRERFSSAYGTFKQAEVKKKEGKQGELGI